MSLLKIRLAWRRLLREINVPEIKKIRERTSEHIKLTCPVNNELASNWFIANAFRFGTLLT